MKVIGVIPARYASTRLPGKPLRDICGKTMIQHVYENAARSKSLQDLLVATDDERIVKVVVGFRGKAILTSPDHKTGTDRVAEAVRELNVDVVVNIQGDEPFINPGMIDEVVQPLLAEPSLPMCTSMHEITDERDFANPNVVKVVVSLAGDALYFSRSLIPHPRETATRRAHEHIGLYAYRKSFLLQLTGLPQSPLEKLESLEQLRVLENGFRLRVIETRQDYIPLSVDTPEDLDHARALAVTRQGNGG
jgi:3-deoxy-manno-octulosonate cytidylyltransferase (CMP-KDO synthetase)